MLRLFLRSRWLSAALLASPAGLSAQRDSATTRIVPVWRDGQVVTRVSGDPNVAGAAYVIRIWNFDNQIVPPHTQPFGASGPLPLSSGGYAGRRAGLGRRPGGGRLRRQRRSAIPYRTAWGADEPARRDRAAPALAEPEALGPAVGLACRLTSA